MNFCSNCEHRLITTGDGSFVLANLCGTPEVGYEPAISPITGLRTYVGETDDGCAFYAESPHPHCITINPTGQCVYFSAKGGVWFEGAMRN